MSKDSLDYITTQPKANNTANQASPANESKTLEFVKSYRSLPVEVRARLENWAINPDELIMRESDQMMCIKNPENNSKTTAIFHGIEVEVQYKTIQRSSSGTNVIGDEVQALAQMRHPNVIGFIGACIIDQLCLIVTELLPACSLEAFVTSHKATRPAWRPRKVTTLAWSLDILRALSYMHQSDPAIIHRRLCPSVLILSASGVVKISSFQECSIVHRDPLKGSRSDPDSSVSLRPTAAVSRDSGRPPSPVSESDSDHPIASSFRLYAAPELLADPDARHVDPGVDVYAATMVLWFLRTAVRPTGSIPGPSRAGAGPWRGAAELRWPALAAALEAGAAREAAGRPAAEKLAAAIEGILATLGRSRAGGCSAC